jgi:micrococcal nuclease
MKQLSKVALFALGALLVLSCAIGQLSDTTTWYEARITAVIDGDTVQVQFMGSVPPSGCQWSERVRLVGVDTPELFTDPPEYYASEAKAFTNQLYQKSVLLAYDSISAKRDRYGRVLAYIYPSLDSPPINKQLIINGYGYYYGTFSFEPDKMLEFQSAEQYARTNRLGLWR